MNLQELKEQLRGYMSLRKMTYRHASEGFHNRWTALNGTGDIKAETFFDVCDKLRIYPLHLVNGEYHVFTQESLLTFFVENCKAFRSAKMITSIENNRIRLWKLKGGKGMSVEVALRILEKMECPFSGFAPIDGEA